MFARFLTGSALGVAFLLLGTAPALAQDPMGDPNVVPMQEKQFIPVERMVPAGTTITWLNLDAEDHDVVAKDLSFFSPVISTGATWSMTFDVPGRYEYLCDLHANMEAVLVVTDGSAVAGQPVDGPGTIG